MAKGIKIVLPGLGYDAYSDQDPSHFSLFVDGTEDHIIIKEKTRGTESVNAGSSENVSHGLSYAPLVLVHAEVSSGEFQFVSGYNIYNTFNMYVTSSNLVLRNDEASSKNFTYMIFHDQL